MKFKFLVVILSIASVACSKNDNNNSTTVTSQDSYFMQMASYSNFAEISAGSIAAVRGNMDSVKMFGAMMIGDHTKAQSSLDSLGTSLSVALPTTPDSVHQAMAVKLQTLSGKPFDTTYIGTQVIDHEATIALFQQELSKGNNAQVKNFATINLPIIEMHLQDAQTIQLQIK